MQPASHFLLTIPLILCAGCAARGDYPSLAPRPIESVRFDVAPRSAPPAAPIEATPDVAVQRAAAEAARAAFVERLAEAERAIAAARGAAAGSEAWVEAQGAISRLDRAAGPAAAALATLDRMMIEATAGGEGGVPPGLAAAWEAVAAIVADQRAALESMAGRLPAA